MAVVTKIPIYSDSQLRQVVKIAAVFVRPLITPMTNVTVVKYTVI